MDSPDFWVSGALAAHDKKATQGCQCGYFGDPSHECVCGPTQVQRYRARVSGPLLDRIDIQVEVPGVRYRELADHNPSETSAAIRERVVTARSSSNALAD